MLNFTPARVLRSSLFCALSALASMPASAASLFVSAGGDLQGALNQARGGDTITLQAGATFTGHYSLAVNSGATITIQSSAMSSLPAGQRVSPSQYASMAKLVTPDASAVLVVPSGANNYVLQGIEFAVTPGVYVQDLIQVGAGGETSTSQLPSATTFDRSLIHGDRTSGGKRGIAMNGINTTVQNSYFYDFISTSQDTQAICGWNGPGPFLIQNNHLEAGTEIVAFGGAVPSISGLIPSNITIQNNEFFKPTRYYAGSSDYAGIKVWAKNMIEFKNGQNATIQNNIFTNNFVQADQRGFGLVFNVRDENGQVPWATVNHITVTGNRLDHMPDGVVLSGQDADGGGSAHDFTFRNNLWTNLGVYGGDGRLYQIQSHSNNVTIDHDTAFPTGYLFVFAYSPSAGLHVTNSIYTTGSGIAADNGTAWDGAFATDDPDGSFTNNVVIGGNANQYSGSHFANNYFPASTSAVGFNSDNSLSASSPYHNLATDGKDLGDTMISSGSGSSSGPSIPTGWVNIISKNSNKCLDVAGMSTAYGATIWQWACWGGDNQKFQFVPVSGGYQITVKNSGLTLDVWGGAPNNASNGLPVKQSSYWGGPNQTFQLQATPDGYFTIHPTSSGQCLDVAGASTANGATVWQWTCYGIDNQKWSFVPAQ